MFYDKILYLRALLGFVSRQEAEEFLKSSEVGTFLIRFSDSELGGVTVAWSSREWWWCWWWWWWWWWGVELMWDKKGSRLISRLDLFSVHETTQEKEVAMLQPFTRKDLMIRSLPDRIHDCHQMINLYPNIQKDQAFGKYYSSPPETVNENWVLKSLHCLFPPRWFLLR